jgi:hypothetical protein
MQIIQQFNRSQYLSDIGLCTVTHRSKWGTVQSLSSETFAVHLEVYYSTWRKVPILVKFENPVTDATHPNMGISRADIRASLVVICGEGEKASTSSTPFALANSCIFSTHLTPLPFISNGALFQLKRWLYILALALVLVRNHLPWAVSVNCMKTFVLVEEIYFSNSLHPRTGPNMR